VQVNHGGFDVRVAQQFLDDLNSHTCQAHKLGLCAEPCGETRMRFLQVHHILQRQQGGTHDLDNLITICRVHHIQIHPHMAYDMAVQDKVLDAAPDREL
jgi:5-methylcytosine-specific restriction endonuclease McrA